MSSTNKSSVGLLRRTVIGLATAIPLAIAGLGVALPPAQAVPTPQTVPVTAPAVVAPTKVSTDSIFHPNLTIVNTGRKKLKICHNWNYLSDQWTATSCRDSSTGTLTTGQSSRAKYGWVDTDAVKIYKGYRLKEKRTTGSGRFRKTTYNNVTTCTHRSDYYLKVQPGLTSSITRYFYYKKC